MSRLCRLKVLKSFTNVFKSYMLLPVQYCQSEYTKRDNMKKKMVNWAFVLTVAAFMFASFKWVERTDTFANNLFFVVLLSAPAIGACAFALSSYRKVKVLRHQPQV